MLDLSWAVWSANLVGLVLSLLVVVAIPLGVVRLVFSIGRWKTRIGISPSIMTARGRARAKPCSERESRLRRA